MTWELGIVIAVTVLALVLFISERLRVDLVAMLVLSILLLTGILSPTQGLAGFSNDATVAIGAMFVLSEGLRQTGALNGLARNLTRLFDYHYHLGLVSMMVGVAVASAFVNNVAIVAIMLPVMLQLCRDIEVSPTKLLIPLSFAAMFGGTTTLIGTSANLLVSGLVVDLGYEPIAMFEMTLVGIAFVVVGCTYLLLVGNRLLPDRGGGEELDTTYELGEFRADMKVQQGHASIGERASEFFAADQDAQILGVLRNGILLSEALEDVELQSDDVLRISASARAVRTLNDEDHLDLLPLEHLSEQQLTERDEDLELFEIVVTPDSPVVGKTLGQAGFEQYFPALLIALRRADKVMVDNLLDVPLRGGDVLLVQAPRAQLQKLQKSEDYIVVSEIGLPQFKTHLLLPVLAIMTAVVVLAAIGWMPIVNLAVGGAVILILIGVLSIEDAYRAIDWQVIFLLGGFIPLGTALEETGAIVILADALVELLGGYGPLAMMAGFYFVTNFMSDVVSNQATAVLMTPIAVATALSMGADPRPFIIAIAFACSASFASPVGYHTNVMIYTAGNYRYMDFVKVGVPLNLLFLVTAVVFIPLIWQF